jgi:hypothetical protein
MSKELTTNQTIAKLLAKMNEKEIEEYLNSVDKLEEILDAPPTEQEVCEALEKWVKENIPDIWNYKVYHDNGGFHYYKNCDFEEYLVEYERIDKAISLSVFLPPHLITMIGKFYEGKVKE